MNAFSLTPSSLLSKNDASLRNPSLSYIWWFYFCLFLLEQFINRGVANRRECAICSQDQPAPENTPQESAFRPGNKHAARNEYQAFTASAGSRSQKSAQLFRYRCTEHAVSLFRIMIAVCKPDVRPVFCGGIQVVHRQVMMLR